MKFLLDVHMNVTLARVLNETGHDVLRAALEHRRWTDERLLALAVDEERIIISQDSDFSELIYGYGRPAPPAVLYLRCEPEQQVQMNTRVFEVLATERFHGHMVVLEPDNLRFRLLPGKARSDA